ncbi:hypothetical protein SL267_22100 [Serratia marcescens]|nr:hypothetical protein SL267_22100 [Serratia marcescens]
MLATLQPDVSASGGTAGDDQPDRLEDWKAKGVPWRSVDRWFERELNTTAEGIRNYEQRTCCGRWRRSTIAGWICWPG